MKRLALFICVLSSVAGGQVQEVKTYHGQGWFSTFKRPYLPREIPPIDYANSNRLDSLMRAGNIYLSLQDAIALALENNLDIEYARYVPRIADSDVLRASAGTLLRGSRTNIRIGSSSATGASSSLSTATGIGGGGGVLSGLSIQLAGTTIPNLDPEFQIQSSYGHFTRPQTNSFVTGITGLVSNVKNVSYSISKGFLTGTNVSLSTNSNFQFQNSPTNDFNPTSQANMSLTITQPLLSGFGLAVNNRAIRQARNERHRADLDFKLQVMATVKNVIDLYWDLVAFNDNLKVQQHALELNQKLYGDNKKRVAIGTIAPIEIVQAEAEVASAQQAVTNAETQVLQQEMILKNVLTRSGVDTLAIAEARIIPTDTFQVPEKEEIRPVQDLIGEAFANRPEIEENRIQIENTKISMQGTRSALLPSLTAYLYMQNNGLAGQLNTLPLPPGLSGAGFIRNPNSVNPYFLGGYGTVLSQLFGRNFPDYQAGFAFSVPIRNRSAQADMIRAQLDFRQQQINDRQFNNQLRVSVLNARIALQQARAAYETSVRARMLQEQTLAGETRKYQLGTSSFLNVVIVQRDLVARQLAETNALATYIRSRNNLDLVIGETLPKHNVQLDEAYSGVVKRPPAPLPVIGK